MDNEQYLETALRVLCRLNSAPNQTLDPLSAITLYAGKTLQQGELPANHTRLIKKQGKLPAQAFRKQLRGYFLTLELKTMLK